MPQKSNGQRIGFSTTDYETIVYVCKKIINYNPYQTSHTQIN